MPMIQVPDNLSTEELLKDDVSFLKVGSKMFTLTPINCDIKQTIDHIHDHYKARVERSLADLNLQAYNQADAEANEEFMRIAEQLRAGRVNIPGERREEVVTSINNVLCPVKTVQYYVTCMRGRFYNFSSDAIREIRAKHPNFSSDSRGAEDRNLVITFQTAPCAVMQYALCNGNVAVNRKTYHSFNDRMGDRNKWYRLCTGNVQGTTFFNAASFEDSVRVINLDSPARLEMLFDVPNRTYSTVDLLREFQFTYAFTTDNDGDGWATPSHRRA